MWLWDRRWRVSLCERGDDRPGRRERSAIQHVPHGHRGISTIHLCLSPGFGRSDSTTATTLQRRRNTMHVARRSVEKHTIVLLLSYFQQVNVPFLLLTSFFPFTIAPSLACSPSLSLTTIAKATSHAGNRPNRPTYIQRRARKLERGRKIKTRPSTFLPFSLHPFLLPFLQTETQYASALASVFLHIK